MGGAPARTWRALHARVANLRRDGLHKLTTRLAASFGTLVVEDLNVAGMLRNRRLARHIADAGFGEFRRQLAYKTGWRGGELMVADRWFASSKTCSGCGGVKPKLRLSDRIFRCECCGLVLDRDLNAARNLKQYVARSGRETVNGRGADQKTTRIRVAGGVETSTNPTPHGAGARGYSLEFTHLQRHTCPMADWETAWRAALYAPGGFFARGERPAQHFRTAPLVGPELAEALLVLLDRVDVSLGRPPVLDFVDMGAGGGELASAVRSLAAGDLARRLRVTAVDLGPSRSLPGVRWTSSPPPTVVGLLVGHEWLDAVPCPVVSAWRGEVVRLPGGTPVTPAEAAWLRRWWPLAEGECAEAGTTRDAAWASAVARVRGAALAVDYGHLRADRAAGRYPVGTLAGYRAGQRVRPVPDGSCDITAHVAFDSCAAAASATDTVLVSQRDALSALELCEPAPAAGLAITDPPAWLDASARASRIAELRATGGFGDFGWLLQTTGEVRAADLLPPLPPWRPRSSPQ